MDLTPLSSKCPTSSSKSKCPHQVTLTPDYLDGICHWHKIDQPFRKLSHNIQAIRRYPELCFLQILTLPSSSPNQEIRMKMSSRDVRAPWMEMLGIKADSILGLDWNEFALLAVSKSADSFYKGLWRLLFSVKLGIKIHYRRARSTLRI